MCLFFSEEKMASPAFLSVLVSPRLPYLSTYKASSSPPPIPTQVKLACLITCAADSSMDLKILCVLLAYLCIHFISMEAQQTRAGSKITVRGIVYCDLCSTNTLSRHSYLLPGVDVHIDCKFEANTPTTSEFMSFSGNRTTDKNGVYKAQIPSVDGVKCGEGALIELLCRTFLIKSPSASCNAPGLDVGSKQKTIQIRHANHCTYWLSAMSFRPPKRDHTLCGI